MSTKYAVELRTCDILNRKQALAAYEGMTLNPKFSTNLSALERVEYNTKEEAMAALADKSCRYEYTLGGDGQAIEWMLAEEDEDSSGACVTNYYFPKESNLSEFLNHMRCGGESSDVVNSLGMLVAECDRDWDDIVMAMDPELAESLHSKLAPCSNQEFFSAYCQEHEKKYGEPFIWDTENA